ncbi:MULTISPECIES: helix-turn-helix transcriptional regulator [Microbacterium]|uniref:AraC family transcriptional regulator n=1 Tax=Microbacterium wangchenii TaxID=2541726 RepID=A0ABX5SXV5_9MICO|nr:MULTISPECIES: AraC family transcriptional regulator [Microbacterium]MCK6067414.1 AraC family transcriptional regulator [Microbacterium sp. EYE_512]QBR89649.1 AraC family transcriptional regulator [Microbacterium wangchenii]TXK16752.1 helix-turn-helix transcriptional regulator [Microbacterium wangchenii]
MAQVLRARARGAEDVESVWRRVVPSARLDGADRRPLAFDWTSVTVRGLTVVSYDLTASVRSVVQPEDELMACRVVTADGWVGNDHEDLDPSLPWLSTDRGMRARWVGRAQVRALVLDRREAEHTARRISGDDRLVLRATEAPPTSVAAARQWERAYRYIRESSVAAATEENGDGVWEAELHRHATLATLSAFSTTFQEALERAAQTRPAPATVRRAIAFIEAHAQEPITVDDIATAARISTRGLQYAFRRSREMPPTEYLRSVRLAGAHDDLAHGASGIATVARRWGFGSPSRFAAYYRRRYGHAPAETLRDT